MPSPAVPNKELDADEALPLGSVLTNGLRMLPKCRDLSSAVTICGT